MTIHIKNTLSAWLSIAAGILFIAFLLTGMTALSFAVVIIIAGMIASGLDFF